MHLRRFLSFQSKGVSTNYVPPDWYGHIQAAKYLNVAPWELLEQSVFWRDKAIICMTAEHEASEIIQQHGGS